MDERAIQNVGRKTYRVRRNLAAYLQIMIEDTRPMLEKTATRSILINAPASQVWAVLTDLDLVKQWHSPEGTAYINTTWEVGSPILFEGMWHKIRLRDKGTVLQFQPEKTLQYSYYSKLSRLPDAPESYSVTELELTPQDNGTLLTVTLSHFAQESGYGHARFYWTTALHRIKQLVENGSTET